jgi:hypothetical protein
MRSLRRAVSVCQHYGKERLKMSRKFYPCHVHLTIPRLLGERSRWSGYLQSLPPLTIPIGLLWSLDDAWTYGLQGREAQADAWQAAALARGTEIETELHGEEGGYAVVRLPFVPLTACCAVPFAYENLPVKEGTLYERPLLGILVW